MLHPSLLLRAPQVTLFGPLSQIVTEWVCRASRIRWHWEVLFQLIVTWWMSFRRVLFRRLVVSLSSRQCVSVWLMLLTKGYLSCRRKELQWKQWWCAPWKVTHDICSSPEYSIIPQIPPLTSYACLDSSFWIRSRNYFLAVKLSVQNLLLARRRGNGGRGSRLLDAMRDDIMRTIPLPLFPSRQWTTASMPTTPDEKNGVSCLLLPETHMVL